MPATITVSKRAFVQTMNSLFMPNPDDPGNPGSPWGPWGPGGPVSREFGVLGGIDWSRIAGPFPEPWRRVAGPHPDPWHQAVAAGYAAQYVINYLVQSEMVGEFSGQSVGTISFDDPELCPRIIDWVWILRHWKGPRPPKGDDTIGVHEYLVAAVQFQNAADAFVDRASGRMFGMVADQLFEAAARIE